MELKVVLFLISSALISSTDSTIVDWFYKPRNRQAARATALPEGVPADYPVHAISQLIRQNEAFYRSIFSDEELTTTESRFLDPDDLDLCETTSTIEVPAQLPRVSDGKVMIIAQDFTNNIQQRIRHVNCKNTGECSFKGFPSTYESYCRQEHSERKLYVYQNGSITSDLFLSPSCCTCHLRRTYGD